MGRFFTEAMVLKAIELAEPSIGALLNTPQAVWGPKWVAIAVNIPKIKIIEVSWGISEEWREEWGSRDKFKEMARKKAEVAMNSRSSSDVLMAKEILASFSVNDFHHFGGIYENNKAVAVAGAKKESNETIARIIIAIIDMLVRLEKAGGNTT